MRAHAHTHSRSRSSTHHAHAHCMPHGACCVLQEQVAALADSDGSLVLKDSDEYEARTHFATAPLSAGRSDFGSLLHVVCCTLMLHVVCCTLQRMLYAARSCCTLYVARCMLYAARSCCTLHVACCMLPAHVARAARGLARRVRWIVQHARARARVCMPAQAVA